MNLPPNESRHPIESLASDVTESMRGGRKGKIEPVVGDPDLESELRDLLPVIERLEKARKTHAERPGGLASLGASRPDRLGDYELVRQIGRGGMGVVFEAVQKSLGRKVAVKVLPKTLLSDENQLQRFEQEARMAGSLHHTNIVPVFGVGDDHGFHYYVMQRIHGQGLDRLLADGAKLTPDQVASLGYQAASALAYAHQQNVLHRDIKPANLIVDDDLQLWVTDFGVAKAIESEASTRTGDVVGTLRYMAPEQIVGETDFRSDIYSLGVTLYELLAGRPAIDDASVREALIARRPAPAPPPLRQLNPDVPKDLETILQCAMSADVERRYSSAEQMSHDLQSFLDREPISVRRMSVWESAMRWANRNPAVAGLSALSAVLLVAITISTMIAYYKVDHALAQETKARTRAEFMAGVATGALDEVFGSFSGSPDDEVVRFSASAPLSTEVADLLASLTDYYGELAKNQSDDPELSRSTAYAHYAMGDIHHQLGNYDDAIHSFSICLAKLADDESERSHLREARIRNRIGSSHQMQRDREGAIKQHEAALEILSSHSSDPSIEREVRFETARTHFLLAFRLRPGTNPLSMPRLVMVNSPLESEINPRPPQPPLSNRPGAIPNVPPRPRPLGERRINLPQRAALGRNIKRGPPPLSEARRDHFLTAMKILRELVASDSENIHYQIALAATLRQLAGDNPTDRDEDQIDFDNEANKILADLHRDYPNDSSIQAELAESLSEVAVFSNDMSLPELEKLLKRLNDASGHFQALVTSHPNVPNYTNRLVHLHFKRGVIEDKIAELCPSGMRREFLQDAANSFQLAIQDHGILLHQYENARGYRAWLALFQMRRGENAIRTNLLDQAERKFNQAIDNWTAVTEQTPEESVGWAGLRRSYILLSHAQMRLGKHDEAEESLLLAESLSNR